MELLYRREQSTGAFGRVNFKLWGKIEIDDEEQAVITKYRFDEAVLIDADQPTLLRNSLMVGLAAFIVIGGFFGMKLSASFAILVGLIGGGVVGYLYFHQKRETIFVRDLLHGRNFTCPSVVELARKEAWLAEKVGFLRQVMESAKNWDGTERFQVDPLPKDEARRTILRGF